MKKILALAIIVSLFALAPQAVFAHPGNTDKKGGHTCRTNCAKWGLKQGQYHYHKRK
ncbi:YHYH domain-containing protein [Patescibacteria group bacterium]|nr:YHYH domain-containing protein [Patescibacteria group bacterium]